MYILVVKFKINPKVLLNKALPIFGSYARINKIWSYTSVKQHSSTLVVPKL